MSEVNISPRSNLKSGPDGASELSLFGGLSGKESSPTIALDNGSRAYFGVLDAKAFAIAKSVIPELNGYQDYDDWLDAREGAQMGLTMAGVDCRLVDVELGRFLTWCGRAGRQPSEAGLDAYAATIGPQQPAAQPSSN